MLLLLFRPDCGVPSAFEEAMELPCVVSNVNILLLLFVLHRLFIYRIPHQHSPLHNVIGNVNEDCYLQEKTRVFERRLD